MYFFMSHFLLIEKGQQYLSSVEEDSDQAEHMKRARKTFCTVITRINNASHTIGKDGKVCLFVSLFIYFSRLLEHKRL